MKMPNELIREEIKKNGVLCFARFMEIALYCPETGYYEKKKDNVGRGGDFVTSVSVGSLFGELLAFQFSEWLAEIKNFNPQLSTFSLVEAGAHDGKLAADILSWLRLYRPQIFEQIKYCILEPSAHRQAWQQETLKQFAPHVRWFSSFENLKSTTQNSKLAGIVFGNELLDAFPVHRFGWDAKEKKWFEWGVALDGEKFAWTKMPDSKSHLPSALRHLPSALLSVLPDGYTIETSPSAESWWREATGILAHGKLLVIDYGYTADEQFSPARTRGTLRGYFRHHLADDVLANVGEQDLTAHVNFSAIQKVGEEAGLKTEKFCPQPQFLTRILEKRVKEKSLAGLSAKQIRQFQTLTHPEHLGRAFRVLVQSR